MNTVIRLGHFGKAASVLALIGALQTPLSARADDTRTDETTSLLAIDREAQRELLSATARASLERAATGIRLSTEIDLDVKLALPVAVTAANR